jgi:hypothetical protein
LVGKTNFNQTPDHSTKDVLEFESAQASLNAISLTSYYIESTKGIVPQPSAPGINYILILSLTGGYFFSPGQAFG